MAETVSTVCRCVLPGLAPGHGTGHGLCQCARAYLPGCVSEPEPLPFTSTELAHYPSLSFSTATVTRACRLASVQRRPVAWPPTVLQWR